MNKIFILLFLLVGSVDGISFNYQTGEAFAFECDANDPLSQFRDEFYIPTTEAGVSQIYLCGHSLGLQPKKASLLMQNELVAWSTLGVEGHFKEDAPWYSYHTLVQQPLARLVGAYPHEVVAMNSLTVNLHLMLVSFYKPTESRYKILMEAPVFSSDTYAVKSQMKFHGVNPDTGLIIVAPRENEETIRMEDVCEILDREGGEISLVLMNGVNYLTGQFVDVEAITKKAHDMGCIAGFDLAHTVGNVPLQLHDWDVDFAAWCSYKYLNAGPGAIGGVYVHEKHCENEALIRFAGWWGNDPNTRFALHLQPDFIPVPSADSWQISNPSIFALAPLRASLELFDRAGSVPLREKSVMLTGYLEYLLNQMSSDRFEIITPSDPTRRGCQLSIKINDNPEELLALLQQAGIMCDFRRPNILRITPIPLYNTYHEVWQFASILKAFCEPGRV